MFLELNCTWVLVLMLFRLFSELDIAHCTLKQGRTWGFFLKTLKKKYFFQMLSYFAENFTTWKVIAVFWYFFFLLEKKENAIFFYAILSAKLGKQWSWHFSKIRKLVFLHNSNRISTNETVPFSRITSTSEEQKYTGKQRTCSHLVIIHALNLTK